jgi:hypothetical protein
MSTLRHTFDELPMATSDARQPVGVNPRVVATHRTRAGGSSSKSTTPCNAIRPASSSGAALSTSRSAPGGNRISNDAGESAGHQAATSMSDVGPVATTGAATVQQREPCPEPRSVSMISAWSASGTAAVVRSV